MALAKTGWGESYHTSVRDILDQPDLWKERLYRSKVLVLRGLHNLSQSELIAVHRCFGRPWTEEEYRDSNERSVSAQGVSGCFTEYGNLITKAIGNLSMPWHRDIPWHREKRYPIRSLYPVSMTGGAGSTGTEFCNCNVLLDRLRPSDLDCLAGTTITIQNWYEVQAGKAEPGQKEIPLVEPHPRSGDPQVLLNSFLFRPGVWSRFAVAYKGAWVVGVSVNGKRLPYEEGHEWLEYLHSVATTMDNIYTHSWEVGDLVLFDNFSGVFHRRDSIDAPGGSERKFWRMNLHHEVNRK